MWFLSNGRKMCGEDDSVADGECFGALSNVSLVVQGF